MIAGLGVELLTPGEVAKRFKVRSTAVTRWGVSGRLVTTRTLGGHHRFFAVEVDALLRGESRKHARQLALAEKARLSGGGHLG
jgi:predicted site-specific integrase-resolvase